MIDLIRTSLEHWGAAVGVASIIVTGLLAIGAFLYRMIRTGPMENRKTAAETRKANADVGAVTLNQLVTAMDALGRQLDSTQEDLGNANDQIDTLRTNQDTLYAKMSRLEDLYYGLRAWFHSNVVRNWDEIRQLEDPPVLPPEHSHWDGDENNRPSKVGDRQ